MHYEGLDKENWLVKTGAIPGSPANKGILNPSCEARSPIKESEADHKEKGAKASFNISANAQKSEFSL